ncbi:MAG: Wzz/FepE/Etk N-terminal domain-containing protein, partial [Sphingomonas sp.]
MIVDHTPAADAADAAKRAAKRHAESPAPPIDPAFFDRETTEIPAAGRLTTIRASLRHHRRWVLGAIVLVLAAALIAYLLMPRRYTARADVWLDHGFERLNPAAAPATAASNSPLARNTEVRLLASRELAAAVVDRLGLANVRGVGQPRNGPAIPREDARRQAIDVLRDNLRIETNGRSYAVAVRYTAADRVLATGILNTLADSYVADRRVGGVRGRERLAMQAQVAAAREQTIRDEATARGLGEAIDLVRAPADRAALVREIGSLDAAIRLAATEEATAASRLAAARGDGSEQITSPRLRELRRNPASPHPAEIAQEIAFEVRRLTRLAEAADTARGRTRLLASARARAANELAATDRAVALRRRMDA